MYQCAQFLENPIKPHGEAVKRIGIYLKGTDLMVIHIRPRDGNFKVWAYADFGGNWFPEEDKYDSNTARSCLGFVVSYLVCPVMWKLQLQTEISLRSTESEYITLIQSLRKTIPIIDILK